MNLTQLQAAFDAGPVAREKLDSYMLAAIATGFGEFALGLPGETTVAIGFTVHSNVKPEKLDATQIEMALGLLFAAGAGNRLTEAHFAPLSTTGTAYLTADVTWALLLALAQSSFVSEIQLCANLAPRRAVPRKTAGSTAGLVPLPPYRCENKKILALIDHGCPFAHSALLKLGKTRVSALWDQDTQPDFAPGSGSVPQAYGYGRQLDAHTLNGFIAAATVSGHVDENRCYEEEARYGALRSRCTHGSLTLGILAGSWLSPSLSASGHSELRNDDADVIFVQLPRTIPMAPARGCIERSSLDGVRYVLDCAPDHAKVAVVIDYGTEMGPHDGSSWFERALDALVDEALKQRKIQLNIVFPSGNSYLSRRHAVIVRAYQDKAPSWLGWWTAKGNDSAITLEIWMDANAAQFELKITPPDQSAPFKLQGDADSATVWPSPAAPVFSLVNKRHGRQRVLLFQASATHGVSGEACAPSGVWQLEFAPRKGAGFGPLYAYTCWGGQNPGMPQRIHAGVLLARPNPASPVSVQGEGGILGSGCGNTALMATGHEKWGPRHRAPYASGGNARGGRRASPASAGADYSLPTEETASLPGLLCLGTRSGIRVRARGTSFAAPQLARLSIAPGFPATVTIGPALAPPKGTVVRTPPRKDFREKRL